MKKCSSKIMTIVIMMMVSASITQNENCGVWRKLTSKLVSCIHADSSTFDCSAKKIFNLRRVDLPTETKDIKRLMFKNCCLESVAHNSFEGIINVVLLDLSYNSLRNLDNSTFSFTKKLRHLDIRKNQLEDLHYSIFSNTKNLTYLDLSYNKLEILHYLLFDGLRNLKYLNIRNNNLHSLIYSELLASQEKLESLLLGNNTNMMTVDEDLLKPLKNIKILDFSGNHLKCDCRLKRTFLWCLNQRLETKAVCFHPFQFKGRSWRVMNSSITCEGNKPTQVGASTAKSDSGVIIVVSVLIFLVTGIGISILVFYCKKYRRSAFNESIMHSRLRANEDFQESVPSSGGNIPFNFTPAIPSRDYIKTNESTDDYPYAYPSIPEGHNPLWNGKLHVSKSTPGEEYTKRNYCYE